MEQRSAERRLVDERSAGGERAPERILIVKPSSLGDIVHALPVLAGLRGRYPQAHLAWLVAKPFASLLEGHPLLDEVIVFDRDLYGRAFVSPRAMVEFWRFVWRLRRRRFDLVIDLQGLFRSGFLTWASGSKRRVGFADARELSWVFCNQRLRPSVSVLAKGRRLHAVERNLALARALGLPVDPPQFPLGLRADEVARARELLDGVLQVGGGEFIAAIPSARWPTKLWPVESWAELLSGLAADGLPPAVLLGGPGDRLFAGAIESRCSVPLASLVGRTSLRELAAVLSLAGMVVCQDSGPMHIAAALGRPLVAVFGPTDPALTGPYSPVAEVVQLSLDCVPCLRRACPLEHHGCMRRLAAEVVRTKVRESWSKRAASWASSSAGGG